MNLEAKNRKIFKRASEYQKSVSKIFHGLAIHEAPRCMVSFSSVYLSIKHAIGADSDQCFK